VKRYPSRVLALACAATTIASLAVAGGSTAAAAAPAPKDDSSRVGKCTTSTPFVAGVGGYASYRIPAVVTTPHKAVLAFAEGRVGGTSDAGNIDIVARRSTDGGCTWGPQQVVADLGDNTIGNPSPVVDPKTGEIVLVSTYNLGTAPESAILRGQAPPRTVYVQRSTDDGATFSPPREIGDTTRRPDWRWYATGPGHAIAITSGPHQGRLVVAANHSIAPPAGSTDTGAEAKYYGGHSLLSDDGGHTWAIGFSDDNPDGVVNANESQVAELPGGTLYFNSRDQNGTTPGNRLDLYSTDGGQTFVQPYVSQSTLWEVPVVEGSVLSTTGGTKDATLIFSGPSNPNARSAMAIWRSDNQGRTFSMVHRLSGLPAAYSDLVQLSKTDVGILYETGRTSSSETIELTRVPLKDLRD